MFYNRKEARKILEEYGKYYSVYKAHYALSRTDHKATNGVIKKGKRFFGKTDDAFSLVRDDVVKYIHEYFNNEPSKALNNLCEAVCKGIDDMQRASEKRYLINHREFRSYYTSEKFKQIFGDRMNALVNDRMFARNRRIVALANKDSNFIYFVDLENPKEDKIVIRTSPEHEAEVDLIVRGLQKYNSFIGRIEPNHLFLLINILESYKGQSVDNKVLYKEYKKVLEEQEQRNKDKEENKVVKIKKEFADYLEKSRTKLRQEHNDGKITDEEYLVKSYIYLIMEKRDIDKIFKYAPEEQRPYLIAAYDELFQKNNRYNTMYRSLSKPVNKLLYERRRKKEEDR